MTSTLQRMVSLDGMLVMFVAVTLCSCGSSFDEPSAGGGGVTLTFAHAVTLGLERDALDELVETFNRTHPGITVRQERMESNAYEDLGLIKFLESGNPPDIYYEWGGWRVRRCVAKNWALDLTPYMEAGWRDWFYEICWSYCDVDGRTYMCPDGASVTTLLWYNMDLFEQLSLSIPEDWPAFVELCKKTRAAGFVPITAGNDELWVMGNWAGHLASRVAGEEQYARVLSLEPGTSMTDPGFVLTLELLQELSQIGAFNLDINSLTSEQGRTPLVQGKALMLPTGTWIIDDWAKDSPDLKFDFFNTPPIPGGHGKQDSLLGLVTGFMVHKDTPHPEEAVAFLKFLSGPEAQRRRIQIGHYSATRAAYANAEMDPHLEDVLELLTPDRKVVAPGDTGFRIAVADEFYRAAAQVIAGHAEPLQALERADRAVERYRHVGVRPGLKGIRTDLFVPAAGVAVIVVPLLWIAAWVLRCVRRRGHFDHAVRRKLYGFLFVAPAYLFFVCIILVPTLGTAVLSLEVPEDEFEVTRGLGFGNHSDLLFRDGVVREAFVNNTLYLLATLVLEVLAGLVMASILSADRPGFTTFRLLCFAPMMLSMVVIGLLWKFIMRGEGGLFNEFLSAIGLETWSQTTWLADPTWTLPTICGISGWIYAGFYMILFHAAIRRIPTSLFESARIDGAGEFQVAWNVILPLLRDVGIVCVLICATGAFKAFDLFYVMSPSGLNRSEMVATYLVKEILDNRNPYYGSAIAVFMTAVVLLISLAIARLQKKSETLEY